MPRWIPVLMIAASGAFSADAQSLYPLRFDRTTHAEARIQTSGPVEQSAVGPALGEWFSDVEAATQPSGDDPWPRSAAIQLSDADDAGVELIGFADLTISHPNNLVFSQGAATNDCAVRFAIAQVQTVNLTGTIAIESDIDYSPGGVWAAFLHVSLRLNRVAGPQLYAESLSLDLNDNLPQEEQSQTLAVPVLFTAELPPGIYDLIVSAEVHAPSVRMSPTTDLFLAESSYVVTLTATPTAPVMPDEGDLDLDGDVDMADFGRLQRAFTGPLP